jgi:hypothetical protein
VPKSLRTIKKSAAKSSVSRSKLRSAVEQTSSSANKGRSKKIKAFGKKKTTVSAGSVSAFVHQPSIIRPMGTLGSWAGIASFVGSKDR